MPNAILIVEDELAIAENIAYALRTEGFFPHHVALGELALSEMRSVGSPKYQLVVLDIGLPDVSGSHREWSC